MKKEGALRKFSVNNQDMLKALNTVSRAISAKTTMPILECIYIEAIENQLMLKGSDGELSIISKLPAIVKTKGSVVIPIKTLSELLRTYPDELVNFSIEEGNVMNINCSESDTTSDVTILGRNAEEYPKISLYDVKDFIRVNHDTLKSMIRDTVFACAYQENISPVLTGILAEYDGEVLQFVALDGFKLALRREKVLAGETINQMNCIVPGRTFSEILKILALYNYDTMIHIANNKFIVNIGDTQIISNLLEGTFIKYESLIPKEIKTIVKLNTDELLSSVSRASLITDESKNSLIKMSFTDDKLMITSESDIGKVSEEVNINKNGEDLKIAFNSKFFVEVLKIITDERIIIEFKDKLSPTLIKPVNSDNYMYLIMPVRYID